MNARRIYKKFLRKHKKELTKLNREASTQPWDWEFGLNYFVGFLKFMQDYYNQDYNIWQSEESLKEVQDTLKSTLDAYTDWINYTTPESEKNIYTSEDGGRVVEIPKKVIDEYNKEYIRRRDKFFKLLGKNIEKWWD